MKWKIHSRDIVDIVFWHSREQKWKIHSRDIVDIVNSSKVETKSGKYIVET